MAGQQDGSKRHDEETDEDGHQNHNDDDEDEEGGFSVDMSPNQTHEHTKQQNHRPVQQRPPVTHRQTRDLRASQRRAV